MNKLVGPDVEKKYRATVNGVHWFEIDPDHFCYHEDMTLEDTLSDACARYGFKAITESKQITTSYWAEK